MDFYAFSGHKMMGPTGIGALYGKRALLEAMPPYQYGGEMIDFVHQQDSTWAQLPYKFEAGTQNIAGAVGLGTAVDYLTSVGMTNVEAQNKLLSITYCRLKADPTEVYGPHDPAKHTGDCLT